MLHILTKSGVVEGAKETSCQLGITSTLKMTNTGLRTKNMWYVLEKYEQFSRFAKSIK